MMGCCEDMGDMKGMMSKEMKEMMAHMMEGCSPEMMMEMMPKCFEMMFTKIPKEKRNDFLSKMISTLIEKGCAEMTEKEKEDFLATIFKKVTA